MSKLNEEELNELFIKFKSGDNKVFETIYSKYNKLVYGISFNIIKNKTDAEDIMQIIFTKIYDMEREKMPEKKCACWLYSLTKNETISFMRKRNNHIDLEEIYNLENENNEINEIVENEKYQKIIGKLNEKEREVVSLKLISKFSFDEIGKLLNIPSSTAKWRYYKALHSLKLLIGNISMFIVTFALGLKFFNSKGQENKNEQLEVPKNEVQNDKASNSQNESIENLREETQKKKDEINDTINGLDKTEIKKEEIKVDESYSENSNIGNIFLGSSIVFLIFSIIFLVFFVKHQLKDNKKASK